MKNSHYIQIFILSIIFDILTGYLKNIIGVSNKSFRGLDSSIGVKGLIKHVIVLILVLTIYPYLTALGFTAYANSTVAFCIFNYTVSVIENLNEIRIKLPKRIENIIRALAFLLCNLNDFTVAINSINSHGTCLSFGSV